MNSGRCMKILASIFFVIWVVYIFILACYIPLSLFWKLMIFTTGLASGWLFFLLYYTIGNIDDRSLDYSAKIYAIDEKISELQNQVSNIPRDVPAIRQELYHIQNELSEIKKNCVEKDQSAK